MPIVGIGVDVVDVPRFVRVLDRTPSVAGRLFTSGELSFSGARLAARFAAKEALAKSLGAPPGLGWHDVEVVGEPSGRPSLRIRGTVLEAAEQRGVRSWHLSLSHDGDTAVAMVVAES